MKKRNIFIEKEEGLTVEKENFEIVERKGLGHPDYICDMAAEISSQVLSQFYLKKFKTVLHHNLDKALLVAGRSEPKFSGGKILKKIKIIIAGRATDRIGSFKIPIEELVIKSVKNWLKNKLKPFIEVEKLFDIFVDYQEGALNLQEVFKRSKGISLANDTSFGVGFAPLTKTEKLTLKLAQFLNSKKFIKKYPFVGKDVKVMSLREKKDLYLTFTVSYIDYFFKNVSEYFKAKEIIKKEVEKYVRKNFDFRFIKIDHNTLDNPNARTENEIYLTVSGLSAEAGDDGQVGRGNRVCGLITPLRRMSMEAPAGKNINHPGKLYQILAHLIANEIAKIDGVKECTVELLSQIGKPLDEPQIALVKLKAKNFERVKNKCYKVVNEMFDNLKKIQKNIVKGKYSLF
jgi:S-adenosylmethionine synthetase